MKHTNDKIDRDGQVSQQIELMKYETQTGTMYLKLNFPLVKLFYCIVIIPRLVACNSRFFKFWPYGNSRFYSPYTCTCAGGALIYRIVVNFQGCLYS